MPSLWQSPHCGRRQRWPELGSARVTRHEIWIKVFDEGNTNGWKLAPADRGRPSGLPGNIRSNGRRGHPVWGRRPRPLRLCRWQRQPDRLPLANHSGPRMFAGPSPSAGHQVGRHQSHHRPGDSRCESVDYRGPQPLRRQLERSPQPHHLTGAARYPTAARSDDRTDPRRQRRDHRCHVPDAGGEPGLHGKHLEHHLGRVHDRPRLHHGQCQQHLD